MWAYTVPGSISAFSFFDGATGVEVMGHDQGSRNRYAVSAFSTTGAMAAHTAWAAPGVFGHVTHRIEVPRGFVRDVDVGLFGAYATWPYGPDSSTLGASRRFGGEIDSWLLSDALPLHVTLVGMHGNDDRGLVHNATANTTFNAGLLQVSYVPAIPLVFFGRLQAIRNTQAVAQQPDDFGDQNFYQLGARHALEINSRFAWIVELSYSRQQIKRAALDGSTAGRDILWAGTHLIF
jgi:hypothetical protein